MEKFELQKRVGGNLSFDPEKRTVSGLCVPYNDVGITRDHIQERVAPGAFGDIGRFPKLTLNCYHQEAQTISRDVKFTDSEEGIRVEAVIAKTPKGDESLIEIRSGILEMFSAEFYLIKARAENRVRVVERGLITGLALVPKGCYPKARIQELREAGVFSPKLESQLPWWYF